MQDVLIALFVGLILGWLIEWRRDWRYWRPMVTALRQENAQLRRQLDARTEADKAHSPESAAAPSSATPTESQGA